MRHARTPASAVPPDRDGAPDPASASPRSWPHQVAAMATMAATGVAVIYIPQPIQTLLADEFAVVGTGVGAGTIAVQAGYALGVILLVSLGDRFSARAQVSLQLLATSLALAGAAIAASYVLVVVLFFVAGAAATVGQLLVGAALKLAPPAVRARTAAVLLGSIIVGLFVVRTGLGAVADAIGWRGAVLACAVLVLALLPVSLRFSPRDVPHGAPSYARILASIPLLAVRSSALRLMTAIHVLCFMAFISLWTVSTAYAVDEHGLTVTGAALLGLAGLAGGAATIVVAPLHARVGARASLTVFLTAALIGSALIALGSAVLPLAVAGLFLLSVGMSSEQVSTQARALASGRPEENGRANTVFMAATFIGGSAASALALALYAAVGYAAVGVLGIALVTGACAVAVAARARGIL